MRYEHTERYEPTIRRVEPQVISTIVFPAGNQFRGLTTRTLSAPSLRGSASNS